MLKTSVQTFGPKCGKMLGLFVHESHAYKFLASPPLQKTLEVRTQPVRFLATGSKVALVTSHPEKCFRQILAMLEFRGNVQLRRETFSHHFSEHRVTQQELDTLSVSSGWGKDVLWGWRFELVGALQPVPHLRIAQGPVIWLYFDFTEILNLKEWIVSNVGLLCAQNYFLLDWFQVLGLEVSKFEGVQRVPSKFHVCRFRSLVGFSKVWYMTGHLGQHGTQDWGLLASITIKQALIASNRCFLYT